MTGMFERFDPSARHVLKVAWEEAGRLESGAVGTEHLLLALGSADTVIAGLLAEAGCNIADLRLLVATRCGRPRQGRDHDALLATLGIDLPEVRRRVEQR
jgi:ATP-dependent Clp protease ATP-binding subunit ClpA